MDISFTTFVFKRNPWRNLLLFFGWSSFVLLFAHQIFYESFFQYLKPPLTYIFYSYLAVGAVVMIKLMFTTKSSPFIEGIILEKKIQFSNNHFTINARTINYIDCDSILFYYGGYTQNHSKEIGNYINFSINGAKERIYFYFEDEDENEDKENLRKLYEHLYLNKIRFKETTNNGISYLMKINLTYNEVQDFKSRYGL